MRFKIVLNYEDAVSGFGWSTRTYRDEVSFAAAKGRADVWNSAYLLACSTQVILRGAQIREDVVGTPTVFYDLSGFANVAGAIGIPPLPSADGILWEGYGGGVNKGRSDFLLHGIPRSYQLDSNSWDLTTGTLVVLDAACLFYFQQYRPAVSPVLGFPIVSPPTNFVAGGWNPYIRLRRTGRPFLAGGQGLRSR